MVESRRLLFSCEHGGNRVPEAYLALFAGQEELLASHRGYDPGALSLARRLAKEMHAPLQVAETTRLLVDLNRERASPDLCSELVRGQVDEELLLERYYFPYRKAVTEKIDGLVVQGVQVVHVSVHSFTPVLDGDRRNTDLGLLYDSTRSREKRFCRSWQQQLKQLSPELKIRFNYPYRGSADGLVRTLRRRFEPEDYLGIELEVNQGLLAGGSFSGALQQVILDSLAELFVAD